MRSLHFAVAASLIAGATATAQEPLSFTIDPSEQWMWSGTTSLGPLLGNPSQDFAFNGTIDLVLEASLVPIGVGQITSADANVVPDLSGVVPNPIPGFPPLATIDVAGLALDLTSDLIVIDAAGNFTAMVTAQASSGTLTVTPLIGSQTQTDLTGETATPQLAVGSLTQTGPTISFSTPQLYQFDFTDSGSGISATMTVSGTLAGDFTCPAPSNYCATSPNSVGTGAVISASGSTSVFAEDLSLSASPVPDQPGIFFYGASPTQVPFGNGFLCVGAPVSRLDVEVGSGGVLTHVFDFDGTQAGFEIASGVTWNFQAWYRDPADGGAFFNLSDGLEVTFCP